MLLQSPRGAWVFIGEANPVRQRRRGSEVVHRSEVRSADSREASLRPALSGVIGHELIASPIDRLLWIGVPQAKSLRDVYDQAVACSDSVATRWDLRDAMARPRGAVDVVVHCREDRHPIDHETAERLSDQLGDAIWLDVLGPLALGVRDRSCSSARSLPFHSLIDEIQLIRGASGSRDSELPFRSVVLLAASDLDTELYRQVIVDAPVSFSWATPSQRSRFSNADLYWWDDSVAPAAERDEWKSRIQSIDPGGAAVHLWICHGANFSQEQAALAGGVSRVLRKPVLLNSLLAPSTKTQASFRATGYAA